MKPVMALGWFDTSLQEMLSQVLRGLHHFVSELSHPNNWVPDFEKFNRFLNESTRDGVMDVSFSLIRWPMGNEPYGFDRVFIYFLYPALSTQSHRGPLGALSKIQDALSTPWLQFNVEPD